MANHGGSGSATLEHRTVSTGLRAPRVAIVIPGGPDWHFWARTAMHTACVTWGGRGFILVPTEEDVVSPVMVAAVVAYDPDYVVTLGVTYQTLERLQPGHIRETLEKSRIASEDFDRLGAELAERVVMFENLETARKLLVDQVGSYRLITPATGGRTPTEEITHERVRTIHESSDRGPLIGLRSVLATSDPSVFGVSEHLDGTLGVAATARIGLVNAPSQPGCELNGDEKSDVVRWLVRTPGSYPIAPPARILDTSRTLGATNGPSAWDMSVTELVNVSAGDTIRNNGLLVVGDSPEDFCLAMAWDRTYGAGLWIAEEWWAGGVSDTSATLLEGLHDLLKLDRRTDLQDWIVTSVSLDEERVADFRDAVVTSASQFSSSSDKGLSHADLSVCGLDVDLIFPNSGKYHFAVVDQYSKSTTMPVLVDSQGSVTLAAAPNPPLLLNNRLAEIREFSWHVDIDIAATLNPSCRYTPAESLLSRDEPSLHTWIRTGRRGLSYEAPSYGFVPAGAAPEDRLSRPKVRKPSLFAWAESKAAGNGYTVSSSGAGLHGELLSTMLGSREGIVDTMSGQMRATLRSFIADAKNARKEFSDGGGCIVRDSVFLTFREMTRRFPGETEELREILDEHLSKGLLRRGLVLGCALCNHVVFQPVDKLASINECPRCGNRNALQQPRWRIPHDEPEWFYDLHPTAVLLMRQNGDIPMLLSKHLRSRTSRQFAYVDTSEFELKKAGKSIAELDLLALSEGDVFVAEVKISNDIDSKSNRLRTARKKVLLAEIFDASQIILATTQRRWGEASVAAMNTALRELNQRRYRNVQLRLITGLGTEHVEDQFYRDCAI